MLRPVSLVIGALVGAVSLGLLGLSVLAANGDLVDPDLGRLESVLGTTSVIVGGIGLVVAALIVAIGMGRWTNPRPVPSRAGRQHEKLQG